MANTMTDEQVDVMRLREALAQIIGVTADPGSKGMFDFSPTSKLYEVRRIAKRALDGEEA